MFSQSFYICVRVCVCDCVCVCFMSDRQPGPVGSSWFVMAEQQRYCDFDLQENHLLKAMTTFPVIKIRLRKKLLKQLSFYDKTQHDIDLDMNYTFSN